MSLKFHRQHVIELYIVDFFCHELGLVVKLDGGQYSKDEGVAYDNERTQFFRGFGT